MNPESDLIQLAYSSGATQHFDQAQLLDLLTFARDFNSRHDISGMLLYLDDTFFQILEGEPGVLRALYGRIEKDNRHAKVIKLLDRPITERTFSDWSMGYAKVTRQELATIPGLNDFFGRGSSFSELEAGKAKQLLEAFREGQWRRRLR
jgi:hypothetical protein